MSESLHLYLGFVPFSGTFSICLFVLSNSYVLGFFFYLILFYFIYPVAVCLFSNQRQKGGRTRCQGSW